VVEPASSELDGLVLTLEQKLDLALAATFPASDAFSLSPDSPHRPRRARPLRAARRAAPAAGKIRVAPPRSR
jgi:hypothetical protein